jgi:hypothetical protein
MNHTLRYVGTAALLSFVSAAIVGYPAAAVSSNPGSAPNPQLWYLISLSLGTVLSFYSAVPKSIFLLNKNWLVIPLVAIIVYLGFVVANPEAVLNNTGWMLLFSMFTFGAPLWPFVLALLLHRKSCSAFEDRQIVGPTPHSTGTR